MRWRVGRRPESRSIPPTSRATHSDGRRPQSEAAATALAAAVVVFVSAIVGLGQSLTLGLPGPAEPGVARTMTALQETQGARAFKIACRGAAINLRRSGRFPLAEHVC
ncbi:hypothetical protein GCM10008174_13160 [Methylopila turkensis]|uniref:Uncharacterized protein n=1 Tax=Methylopila turkensis TaxID=1437816 RepID=A0A9W6JKZ9_9HYPH|nr:hypothetical protein GCM10008174_13160 [Methylopila turkensis]